MGLGDEEETTQQRAERLDQYWTRPLLSQAVVEWAHIMPGDRVLEPSCGAGDLVRHIPDHAAEVFAMDIDDNVFVKFDPQLLAKPTIEVVAGDFLEWRPPSDLFDVVVMNPPYGFVGSGKARKAADRLHVQHALRIAPRVVVLARANFLWGVERYRHVFRFARLTRMAVLTHRPAFYGPALRPDQVSARHDFGVFEFVRANDREACEGEDLADRALVEFWTQDWR